VVTSFFFLIWKKDEVSFFWTKGQKHQREREHSGKRERKEYERGRVESEREIKIVRRDAAPLYLNNIIKNAAIQGGPAHKSKIRRYYIAASVPT
jgi:hypothetical protein